MPDPTPDAPPAATPTTAVLPGDCRAVLADMPEGSFDSVVTDPPYELGFMGKAWDKSGVAFDPATWRAVLRALRPGGYMLACGGSRTYHRLACAIEDAGFEMRDCLMWVYGTGFPKGKGCLKPAYEPIMLVRKPGPKVLPLGIDGCRVPLDGSVNLNAVQRYSPGHSRENYRMHCDEHEQATYNPTGRWPANLCHDGGDEVMEAFAAFGERGGSAAGNATPRKHGGIYAQDEYTKRNMVRSTVDHCDTGTAARFFYCAKASRAERGGGNTHPTVKPLSLCRWLVRLVTPPGGRVLDPFAGSGTTLLAARDEGLGAVGIELDPGYCAIIRKRLAAPPAEDAP